MKILLLSGYDAYSHKLWREGLEAAFPKAEWTQLSLPPRHFRWRIRGNSLSWAYNAREQLHDDYDLLIATSMVDLSALRGFVPALAQVPSLLYFHENQFAYPASSRQNDSVGPQMLSIYSALCADRLVFNSAFNRQTFLDGADDLLRRLPDEVPKGLTEILSHRSQVLPVPLKDDCYQASTASDDCLSIVWNHRWEYDKAPDRLLAGLRLFFSEQSKPLPIKIHLVGQQFRRQPPAFAGLKSLLQDHQALGAWGYIEDEQAYRRLLRDSHVVLSTALHDFQGLSVLEGVAAGCRPLVPERQAYPEWFAPAYRYASHADPAHEARALADKLHQWVGDFQSGAFISVPSVDEMSWRQLGPRYAALLECSGAQVCPAPVS